MGAVWIAAVLVGACGGDTRGEAQAAPAAGPSAAELLGAVVATCADAQGPIEVRRKDAGYWEPAVVGTTLREGDWIRTGEGASARVRLLAGGHIDVAAKSAMLIEAGASVTTLAAAAQGSAVAVPAEAAPAPAEAEPPPQPAEVEPSAPPEEVALTTDTDIDTHTEPAPSPRPPPRTTRPARPRRPRDRDPRPTYPQSVSPAADARITCKPSVQLSWQPVDGATGYRVSIGKDLTFKSIVKFVELKGGKKTSYKYAPVSAGTYAWRVAARNRDGRYGEYGYARRVRCTR